MNDLLEFTFYFLYFVAIAVVGGSLIVWRINLWRNEKCTKQFYT